jgi:prevent-host-death family protein
MSDTLSATEARIHFGELLRKVRQTGRHVVVERAGKPSAVIMSIEEFEQLRAGGGERTALAALERAQQLGNTIRARSADQPLKPPEEVILEAREERDAEFSDLL